MLLDGANLREWQRRGYPDCFLASPAVDIDDMESCLLCGVTAIVIVVPVVGVAKVCCCESSSVVPISVASSASASSRIHECVNPINDGLEHRYSFVEISVAPSHQIALGGTAC
jgi:hypothetical protein